MDEELQLRLLGNLEIRRSGSLVTGFISNKAQALLCYLAVTGRPHLRPVLAGLLWGELPEASALNGLRQALANLRHLVGPHVSITREDVALNPDPASQLDVRAFEARVAGAHVHDMQAGSGLKGLEEAVALYRGDFLEGFYVHHAPAFEEWALAQRARLHELAVQALHALAAYHAQRGQPGRAAAIDYTTRLLALEPWREEAHRQLMLLLAAGGQRSAALAQYETCRRLLGAELAVEPGTETNSLYEQIRDGTLPAAREPPALDVPPAPLPGFLDEKALPAAARPVFVARETELGWLESLLAAALDGRGQAAFVVGGPGRGKTVLLHEFARRALDAHPDLLLAMGTCNAYSGVGDPYLPFRGVLAMLTGDVEAPWAAGTLTARQARQMWHALPDVAPVMSQRGAGLVGTLLPGRELLARARAAAPAGADWLPPLVRLADPRTNPPGGLEQSHIFEQFANVLIHLSAGRPLLLVLDDLQWADQASIGLLFHLGRRIERGRILLAGAYRPHELALGRDGERHPLEPVLAEYRARFGEAWLDLAATDEAEGRLFVDRFLDSEPNTLGEPFRGALFGRTRGHPLFTIELLRAMQQRGNLVQDDAGRWIQGAGLDWDALPVRAQAAIAERIARLPEELRQVLAVASVEGEEFTAQAVALVLGLDELHTLRLLREQLAARHRLLREQGELRLDGRSLSRYRFSHFLFQQHLYQGLGDSERRLLHRRVGEALEQLYQGRLEDAAVQLVHHFAGDPERELRYVGMAARRAAAQSAYEEAVRYQSRALELTPRDRASERYRLLLGRESLYDLVGRRDAQKNDLNELELVVEGLGMEQRAEVSWRRARRACRIANYPAAIAAAQVTVQLGQAARLTEVQALGHMYWGYALLQQGDIPAARAHYAEALSMAQALALTYLEAQVRGDLGRMCEDPAQRQRYYEQALHTAREAGDRRTECLELGYLSASRLHGGDLAAARGGFEQSLHLAREIGDRELETEALARLGSYHHVVGDFARARAYYDEALLIAAEAGGRSSEVNGFRCRADVAHCLGEATGAWEDAQKALELAREIGEGPEKGRAHQVLGMLFRGQGDPSSSHACYTEALRLMRRPGTAEFAEPLAGLAAAELAQGRVDAAHTHVGEILAYLDGGGRLLADQKPSWTYLTCYRVLTAAGDPRAAEILNRAHTQLQEWAAHAPDEATRRSFLERVPWNREIVQEWQRARAEAPLTTPG